MRNHRNNYVVINTHKGLYKYKRLPYGVSSAPGIFRRAMENLLQGIDGMAVYIDDILVTGATEEEHLKALGRLENAGTTSQEKQVSVHGTINYLLGYRIDFIHCSSH